MVAVRKAFESYRKALLDQNGNRAVKWVSRSTVAEYGELRELALHAGEARLKRFSLMKQFTVVLIRLRMDAETVRELSGRELFVYAVDQGLIREKSVRKQDNLRNVIVQGETASGRASTGQAEVTYSFVKQGGRWKVDLVDLMEGVGRMLVQAGEDEGLNEDETLLALLEAATGQRFGDEIWEPLD